MRKLGLTDDAFRKDASEYETDKAGSDAGFINKMRRGETFPQIGEIFSPGRKEKSDARSDIFDRIIVNLEPIQRKAYYIIAGLVLIATFWLVSSVWVKLLMMRRRSSFSDYGLLHLLWYTFTKEQVIFVVALAFGAYLALLIGSKYAKAAERLPDDEIKRPKRRDWTSNDWLNYSPGEIRRVFTLTSPKRPVNIPICMLKGNLLCVPLKPKHWQMNNQNMCIVGLSGTGKTYSGLEVYILTKIAMSHSFFAADTKGAMLENYEALLKKMGYRVQKLILGDWAHSDGWNIFRPLVEAPASRADDYINDMVETLMNTTGKVSERGPEFWTNNEMMLLRGMIYYITRSPAYKGERTIKGLMKILIGGTEGLIQLFSGLGQGDPAYTATSNFRNSSDVIKDSARAGLAAKLQIFETEAVMECLSYDTINIKDSTKQPTATFLVTSDYQETYDVIASLFTSHVYQELVEIADSRKGKKLEKPYYIAVDEICNMAAIKSFSRIISTNRSRNIHVAYAIQSVGQLEDRYGKLWDNIMGNCAITLFFGCGNEDDKTAQVMSKRCGKVLAVTEQFTMSASPLQPREIRRLSGKLRTTEQYVDLLPEAKAKTLLPEELLVCIAGRNVLRAEPYGAHMHPLYDEAMRAKEEEENRIAELKERGIEERPDWVDHYMAQNANAKVPVEKVFPVSEYEKAEIPPAYSIAERRRFLAIAEAEKEEKEKAERERIEFEKYLRAAEKEIPAADFEGRSGAREFAEKITIELSGLPQAQEKAEKPATYDVPNDEYDPEFEDFD